ncbi:MAG: flagellar basal body rod protein FlgC [Bryobacteraceae bacterium]
MSLFSALSVSASGMSAQRARTEVLVENLANAETTRTPEGGPYRRKDVVFQSAGQSAEFSSILAQADAVSPWNADASLTGVEVAEVVTDSRDPERRYQPGHPDADADGNVAYPRVNPAEDMVDLMSASRGYQSNVSAMQAVKDMLHRSIDLLRG